jgi:hypothetical protein
MGVLLPYLTVFGTATAARCQAHSKRSGAQCCKAAMVGKKVCRTHGGASTGPRTPAGRQRCADAKTVHGWETRAKRTARAEGLRGLREIERVMKSAGLIP